MAGADKCRDRIADSCIYIQASGHPCAGTITSRHRISPNSKIDWIIRRSSGSRPPVSLAAAAQVFNSSAVTGVCPGSSMRSFNLDRSGNSDQRPDEKYGHTTDKLQTGQPGIWPARNQAVTSVLPTDSPGLPLQWPSRIPTTRPSNSMRSRSPTSKAARKKCRKLRVTCSA